MYGPRHQWLFWEKMQLFNMSEEKYLGTGCSKQQVMHAYNYLIVFSSIKPSKEDDDTIVGDSGYVGTQDRFVRLIYLPMRTLALPHIQPSLSWGCGRCLLSYMSCGRRLWMWIVSSCLRMLHSHKLCGLRMYDRDLRRRRQLIISVGHTVAVGQDAHVIINSTQYLLPLTK